MMPAIHPVRNVQGSPQVMFGGVAFPTKATSGWFLRTFDFDQFGKTTVPQSMLMYALVIASRIGAAIYRAHKAAIDQGLEKPSYNEPWEHARRDVVGWTCWFFATAIIQRLFIRCFPPKYRDVVVFNPYNKTYLDKIMDPALGTFGRFKEGLKWEFNFLFKGKVPTDSQLQQRFQQYDAHLVEKLTDEAPEVLRTVRENAKKYYAKLGKIRNLASFTGIANTIAVLGVGMTLYNFASTRKNVAALKAKQGQEPVMVQRRDVPTARLYEDAFQPAFSSVPGHPFNVGYAAQAAGLPALF